MTISKPACPRRLAALALLLAGCTLSISPQQLQSVRLFFTLTETVAEGNQTLAASFHFPGTVDTRRRFARLSGRLTPPPGGALPRRLDVVAEARDRADRRVFRLRIQLALGAGGEFSAVRKLRKNLPAESLLSVTLTPVGGMLESGTAVELCFDLARKRADLANACRESGSAPPETFGDIQRQIFTPSCARGGCHDAASASEGLVLAAGSSYGELVGVPSNQAPFRLRVDPGRPESSYLVMKLRGDSGIQGVRMPLDGPPFLDAAELAAVEAWIRRGAPND